MSWGQGDWEDALVEQGSQEEAKGTLPVFSECFLGAKFSKYIVPLHTRP